MKILLWVFLSLAVLIVLIYGLLQFSAVQTYVVKQVTKDLSKRLNTKVSVDKVNIKFLNTLELQGLMVEDRQKDTLLFAGKAYANVTDWFIFKDKIALENISLDNAIVNMRRTDSVWNYQFIIDYFKSPDSKKENKNIELNLRQVHLNNIRFNKIDKWVGQDMIAQLTKLDLLVDSINFKTSHFYLRQVDMVSPLFAQNDYDGNKPPQPDLTPVLEKIPVVNAFKWNNSGMIVSVGKINITDGAYVNDHYTQRPAFEDQFDGKHIRFEKINGVFENLLFLNDTLHAKVQLTANERSGLQVKNLSSNFRFTPEMMEFAALDLQTNQSHLKDYFRMSYKSFSGDMSNFISNVLMTAKFRSSILYSDDIAFFAPSLKTMNHVFRLDGNAEGSVSDFKTTDITVSTGNSVLRGNLNMKGLPDISNTFIDFDSKNSVFNYVDLRSFIPAIGRLNEINLAALDNIRFNGNFTGFIDEFFIRGATNTGLGNLVTDLKIKLPKGAPPEYAGHISSPGFNIGRFLKNPKLGIVALDGDVDGRGLNASDLNTHYTGAINKVYFNGYTYQNIKADGVFANKVFAGKFSINDPGVQISDLDGRLDLSKPDLFFQVKADVKELDLQKLGFSGKPLKVTGLLNMNFTGKTIDDFLGNAGFRNAMIHSGNKIFLFDTLSLNSQYIGDKKALRLNSEQFDLLLMGNFKVAEIPDAFKYFLNKYYPAYIPPPARKLHSTDVTFTLTTKRIGELISVFTPKFYLLDNANLSGKLDLDNDIFMFSGNVHEFRIDQKIFNNLVIEANGDASQLLLSTQAGKIFISDSLQLPATKIDLTASNDVSHVQISTGANKTLERAEIDAFVTTLPEGLDIDFKSSEFIVNGKRWNLQEQGKLVLRKDMVNAEKLLLKSGSQSIEINTVLDEITDANNVKVALNNVIIDDVAPFFITNPSLKGILNGTAIINKPFSDYDVKFTGVADSFRLNDRLVGKVDLSTTASKQQGLVSFSATSNEQINLLLAGTYNLKDSTGNALNIDVRSGKMNLNILEPFLSSILKNLSGNATANLNLKQVNGRRVLTGTAILDSADLTVGYTNVHYKVAQQNLLFGDGFIDLGKLQIRDTLGNTGTLSGRINHEFFDRFSFTNMHVETDKMVLLNTTRKDNKQFYGYVIGRAAMDMSGPISNMQMDITGEPSIDDSSHIVLPDNNAIEGSEIDYIDFIQFGKEMNAGGRVNNAANISVSLNLISNPSCQVDLVLDEVTGDVIKARGNGKLFITVGTSEPLSIRGRYDLTQGDYTFNFQTFLQKPFSLRQGSIVWNGDPYSAILDIDAEYLAKNVDMSPLTGGTSFNLKEDVNILSHITGMLSKPNIGFEFSLPAKSELNRDYLITRRLADFQNDQNAMNKQVASLLLFNTFMLENQNILTQENTLALATNTIGGVMSQWLTGMLNKELQRATNGILSTYIDINPTLNLATTASQLQANVRAGLKILLSDRINLLVGGNFDYNNPYTTSRRNIVTPDINIEWLLNRDGSIRIVGFNKTSVDVTTGQRNRSGVQLSYRKNFDKFSDIFKRRRKIEEAEIPADTAR